MNPLISEITFEYPLCPTYDELTAEELTLELCEGGEGGDAGDVAGVGAGRHVPEGGEARGAVVADVAVQQGRWGRANHWTVL
jgi:hypothetical protein